MKRWDAILKRLNKNAIVAEIGTWKGTNAFELLNNNETLNLYCIDRWKQYTTEEAEREQATKMGKASQDKFKLAKKQAYEVLETYADRAEIIELDSVEASTGFPDNYFDLVFIDALHSYEGCLADIKAWMPKVKQGGYICGHDYPRRPGVVRAVTEIFGEEIETDSDNTWFVRL